MASHSLGNTSAHRMDDGLSLLIQIRCASALRSFDDTPYCAPVHSWGWNNWKYIRGNTPPHTPLPCPFACVKPTVVCCDLGVRVRCTCCTCALAHPVWI